MAPSCRKVSRSISGRANSREGNAKAAGVECRRSLAIRKAHFKQKIATLHQGRRSTFRRPKRAPEPETTDASGQPKLPRISARRLPGASTHAAWASQFFLQNFQSEAGFAEPGTCQCEPRISAHKKRRQGTAGAFGRSRRNFGSLNRAPWSGAWPSRPRS